MPLRGRKRKLLWHSKGMLSQMHKNAGQSSLKVKTDLCWGSYRPGTGHTYLPWPAQWGIRGQTILCGHVGPLRLSGLPHGPLSSSGLLHSPFFIHGIFLDIYLHFASTFTMFSFWNTIVNQIKSLFEVLKDFNPSDVDSGSNPNYTLKRIFKRQSLQTHIMQSFHSSEGLYVNSDWLVPTCKQWGVGRSMSENYKEGSKGHVCPCSSCFRMFVIQDVSGWALRWV